MPQFGWISDESFVERVLLRGLSRRMKVLFNHISALECGWPLILFLNGHPNGLKTSDDYAFLIDMDSPTAESDLYAMIDFGLVQQTNLAGIELFGMTKNRETRELVDELCKWQDLWHDRLARIELLISGPIDHRIASH